MQPKCTKCDNPSLPYTYMCRACWNEYNRGVGKRYHRRQFIHANMSEIIAENMRLTAENDRLKRQVEAYERMYEKVSDALRFAEKAKSA